MDLGVSRALATDRRGFLSGTTGGAGGGVGGGAGDGGGDWLAATIGGTPRDRQLYERALTHGSNDSTARGSADYQRLEFLGDRVLGLVIAQWLFELFPAESEGQLSKRLNALVARVVCADVARDLGIAPYVKLGKQARDDGASDSDNVLGDVMEALIGARFLDAGLNAARDFVRAAWGARTNGPAPRHPKSALLEWSAAQKRATPVYAIADRSGPDHAPRYRVRVSIGAALAATGEGRSKQEAEIAAAAALLAQVKG